MLVSPPWAMPLDSRGTGPRHRRDAQYSVRDIGMQAKTGVPQITDRAHLCQTPGWAALGQGYKIHGIVETKTVYASVSNGGSRGPQRGLECSHCGCRHFRVLYTPAYWTGRRRAWGGRIFRRRECRHCGWRMTTYEREAGCT